MKGYCRSHPKTLPGFSDEENDFGAKPHNRHAIAPFLTNSPRRRHLLCRRAPVLGRARILILLPFFFLALPGCLTAAPGEAEKKEAANLAWIDAARGNSLVGLQDALASGADVDYADDQGATALMYVVNHNNLEAARFLIQKGASVNVLDARGYSALSIAAVVKGNPAIVELLLKNRANPDALWKETRTVLMQVVTGLPLKELYQDKTEFDNALKITHLLVQAGANVHATDGGPVYRGYSILMYAATMHSTEIVRLLIQKKVDVNLEAADGKNALIVAEKSHSDENAKLLKAAGAR